VRLVVARIGRPHGVQGEVTIEVRTDSPEKRFEVGSILFSENNQSQKFTIASARNHNGTLLLKFEEIPVDWTVLDKAELIDWTPASFGNCPKY